MLLQASHQAMPKNRPRTRQAQGQVLGTPELPSPSGHAQNQIPAISPTGESHTSHQPAVAESIRCCAYDHARLRQRHPHSRHTYVNARAYSIECARRPTCPRMPPNGDTEGETILHQALWSSNDAVVGKVLLACVPSVPGLCAKCAWPVYKLEVG